MLIYGCVASSFLLLCIALLGKGVCVQTMTFTSSVYVPK